MFFGERVYRLIGLGKLGAIQVGMVAVFCGYIKSKNTAIVRLSRL